MKKNHKGFLIGGLISAVTGAFGVILGKKYVDKVASKAIGPKIAGDDDDMGAENDPIIDVAKTL